MKIERRPDGTTIIKNFPVFISAMLLLFLFTIFQTLVVPLLERPPRYNKLHIGIIALLFAFAFAHFMWERVRFEFDPRRRIISWKQHKLFTGIKEGQIAFDKVTDVVVETTTGIDNAGKLGRVTLVMKERRLPLMKVYGGNNGKEVAQTIREIIGLENSKGTV